MKTIDSVEVTYSIGWVAKKLCEHPETLRVWERSGLLTPNRRGGQRRYSATDILRLQFIQMLMDTKGLNIAGVRQVVAMYPCWARQDCPGGGHKNSAVPVNEAKPCWKTEGTYCLVAGDRAEFCATCPHLQKCRQCQKCQG